MTKPIEIPPVEKLKLKDLTQDLRYSGRTQKEINDNAREKAAELKAAGGWSPTMPGQYFEGPNGEKFLLAGFSRAKACELNGDKEGYFIRANGDEIDHLLACETSNSVRPLSMLARGLRYVELMKGSVADDFKGAIADPKNAADWKRQPMTREQIAERIGKSAEWVRKCVCIAEAPEAVRDMIENDHIAATVFYGATAIANRYHDDSESKVVAMCKRAYRVATEDGKATATKQHFDAIKEEFIPAKKLVADDGKEKSSDTELATDKPSKKKKTEQEVPESLPEVPNTEPAADLFSESDSVLKDTDSGNKLKAEMAEFLLNPDNVEEITLDGETVRVIVEKLLVIVARHREVF